MKDRISSFTHYSGNAVQLDSSQIKNIFCLSKTNLAIIHGRPDSEKRLLSKYPKQVRTIQDIPEYYKYYKQKLREPDSGLFAFFRKWHIKQQLRKFRKNKHDPLHAGADGELQVLSHLSTLDDSYHVLCGIRIHLNYPVRFNGQKNLRSAQMDFVVVSKKGIFVIEVKNWSNQYLQNYNGFSPYEQTERAGRVLWVALKYVAVDVKITNVLLSIQGNLQYDQNHRRVLVTSLSQINTFLESNSDILSEKQVKNIVRKLQHYV